MSKLGTLILLIIAALAATSIIFVGELIIAKIDTSQILFSARGSETLARFETVYVTKHSVLFPMYVLVIFLVFCAPVSVWLMRRRVFSPLVHMLPITVVYLALIVARYYLFVRYSGEIYGNGTVPFQFGELATDAVIVGLASAIYWVVAIVPHTRYGRLETLGNTG